MLVDLPQKWVMDKGVAQELKTQMDTPVDALAAGKAQGRRIHYSQPNPRHTLQSRHPSFHERAHQFSQPLFAVAQPFQDGYIRKIADPTQPGPDTDQLQRPVAGGVKQDQA